MSGASTTRPGRIQEITAVSNPRIKSIRALAQKKNREETGTFVAEGMKLVLDAFEKGWRMETLVYSRAIKDQQNLQALAAKVRVAGADIIEASDKVITSITRKDNPQSVIGVVSQRWHDPPKSGDLETTDVWVALDRIRDPGNLGTIMRTVDAAGASGIILIGETTDPFSFEAVRSSMGSIFNVQLARQTPSEFLAWIKAWPGKRIGTHLEGSVDYRLPDYSNSPVLLLMGNEQQGLPADLASACDQLIRIPMAGSADSLNLAIATGVMLFQMGKRLPPIPQEGLV